MEGLQMALFDSHDEAEPSFELLESRKRVLEAYSDAVRYGHIAATKAVNYEVLCAQLVGYADGIAIAFGLGASERELLRNYAFSSADPIMLAKQH